MPGQKLHERLQQVVISRYIRENIGKTAFFILISSIPAFAPKGKMEKPRPLCYHGCRNGGDADVDACTGAGGVPAAGQAARDRHEPCGRVLFPAHDAAVRRMHVRQKQATGDPPCRLSAAGGSGLLGHGTARICPRRRGYSHRQTPWTRRGMEGCLPQNRLPAGAACAQL